MSSHRKISNHVGVHAIAYCHFYSLISSAVILTNLLWSFTRTVTSHVASITSNFSGRLHLITRIQKFKISPSELLGKYHIVLGDHYYSFYLFVLKLQLTQVDFFPDSWSIKHVCDVQTFPKFLHLSTCNDLMLAQLYPFWELLSCMITCGQMAGFWILILSF